jgi:oligosaccharide repeat unit polymerase
MSSLGILVLTAALIGSIAAMNAAFSIFKQPTITGTVFVTVLLVHGITAIPYCLDMLERPVLATLPVSPELPWVLAAVFGMYAIGAITASELLRFKPIAEANRFFSQPMHIGDISIPRVVVAGVAAIVIGLLFSFGSGSTGLAMLAEETRDEFTLRRYRINFIENNSYYYIGTLVRTVLGPILMLISFNQAVATKQRMWALAGWLFLAINVLASTAHLHKWPIVLIALYLVINRMFRSRHAINVKLAAAVLVMTFVFGTIGYYLTYNVTQGEASSAALARIFVIPQWCLDSFLNVYPNIVPFDHGMGIGLISSLAGVKDYISPDNIVATIVTGDHEVTANSFWAATMWASFGYSGVILSSFIVGVMMVCLDRWCLTRKRNAATAGLYAYMIVSAVNVVNVSIFTCLLSGGLGLAPFLVAFLASSKRHRTEEATEPWPSASGV